MDKKPFYSTRKKVLQELMDNPKTPLDKALVETVKIMDKKAKKK